ncbi:MAG: ABC transporter permease [Bacilli bacterium]|nr:ABC transporter permease [Bacilli bacterium]
MGKLLKFEFAKLIKAKVFYICLFVSIAIVFIFGLVADADSPSVNSLYFFKSFTEFSLITTVIAIPICIFVCEDAQCGAEKTVLGRGVSRSKFFFAKYISSLIAYMLFVLITMAATYIFAIIKFNYYVDDTLVPFIFLVLLGLFMFHALFFAISTILGKNGFAIAMAILIPTILQLLMMLLEHVIDLENFSFQIFSFNDILNTFVRYTEWNKDLTWSTVLSIVYPVLFIGAAHEVYVRKEN